MLYPNTWFKCAVAAMHTADYLFSITCFTTLLKQNPEFGEGWSNLASVLMKVGKFKEAYEASCQSIRFLRENWHVWDNYVTISVGVSSFSHRQMYSKRYASVIEGLNELLDRQDKAQVALDYALLYSLTYAIINLNHAGTKQEETPSEGKSETPAEGQSETPAEGQSETPSEGKSETPAVDEDAFDVLAMELTGIEEELDAKEEEKEEEHSENDRQFLIKQLTALFDRIQKMVRFR